MIQALTRLSAFLEPIESTFEPASHAALDLLQQEVGHALPAALLDLLGSYAPCGFAGDATVTLVSGSTAGIFTLFGHRGSRLSILKDLDAHPDYRTNGWLPVADDLFNNRFVLVLRTGAVLFLQYSHGSVSATEAAHSFEDFLARIQVTPDKGP